MRSTSLITRLLVSAAGLLAVACTDRTPTAPTASSLPPGAPRLDVIINTMAADKSWADFTVTPTGGLFVIGPHAVQFPDHAICNPATSGYGPTLWNAPCTPLNAGIKVHAVVRTVKGGSYVDFTPSLRFVPTTDPKRYVWMMMKSPGLAAGLMTPASYPILWAPHIGAAGVDESLTDPTLQTYVWQAGGIAFRRVKHFTGYVIATGYRRIGYATAAPVLF